MRTALLLAAAATLGGGAPDGHPDPRRQFDFWIGEWSVQNRHLEPDGTWRDGDVTRARITPVCGGAGILEEWAGPFRGAFMNGFSLRSWDAESARWVLVLFWTTDGNAAFGRLTGTFRHGRGEFFVPSEGPERTRYTFSDALPDSVRWDSARTSDGGLSWRTDWIMEFTRTRPAGEVTQENLLATDWTTGSVSPHPRARALDWLLGAWSGTQEDAEGAEREARLDAKLLDKDCLVLDLLRVRDGPDAPWAERLAVRGLETRRGGARGWAAWSLSGADPALVRSEGTLEEGLAVFERPHPDGRLQELLVREDGGGARIEEALVPADGGAPRLLRTTRLRRD